MGDISSEELRGKAEHCRTLAKAVTDEATRKTLRQMAEELESQADSLDAASPQLRPPPSMA
ncbi:MAG TPA: hypothetical protein VFR52_00425 [Sphingomicrobium sp.]|nr:hypothetical protein [Sphingomicrobium sp.]